MWKEKYKAMNAIILLTLWLGLWNPVQGVNITETGDSNVNFTDAGNDLYLLRINENVPKAKLLKISGWDLSNVDFNFENPWCTDFKYGHSFNQTTGILYLNKSLDYEEINCQIIKFSIVADITVAINIQVNNLDDNPTQFTSNSKCIMKENTIYTLDNTTCCLNVTDADGMLNQTTFTVQQFQDQSNAIFEANFKEKPNWEDKNAVVMIYLKENVELDFEETILYILNLTAQGTAENSSIEVVIDVKDMPDQPPKWQTMITTMEFAENADQEFSVRAIDGDIGINNKIKYDIAQNGCAGHNCTITISENGTITVKEVDREEVGNTISLSIRASEITSISAESNSSLLPITLFIDDVDDNIPVINITGDVPEEPNFEDSTSDEIVYYIDENYLGEIKGFSVQDMDLADNGTYNIKMDVIEGSPVNYTEPFQVIPTSGYQSSDFTLTVRNASRLDYENKTWKNIKFELNAIEKWNTSHIGSKTIVIHLKDLNDEFPIFVNTSDSVTIPEDISQGETIFNATADDKDAGDIVTYEIVGMWGEKLDISKKGIISPKQDNVFDYEQLQQVVLQIKATDTANHETFKSLTLNISDVDDETPIISVGTKRVTIQENCTTGTIPNNAEISARDPDTKPKLKLEIDWSKSMITKNSALVNAPDNKWQCFELEVATESSQKVVGTLKVRELCSPDFELFDAITIGLKVTDLNTKIGINSSTGSILVNIEDINDNAPVFIDSSITDLEVSDGAGEGTKIGTVAAHDDDISDNVTFTIKSLDPDTNWVDIDENSGLLTVKKGVVIDDDIPPRMNLSFEVIAYDNNRTHNATETISIHMIDINDQKPKIQTDTNEISIKEKSPSKTHLTDLKAEDDDRDDPFNRTVFRFDSNITNEAANCFSISENGEIIVDLKNGAKLDRDFGVTNYILPILVYDNPKGNLQFTDRTNITITLLDINDQYPGIVNTSIECSESLKKGDTIGSIFGEDADGPGSNSEIFFEIYDVVPLPGTTGRSLNTSYFNISSQDKVKKIATVQLLQDLKDQYGTYNVSIKTSDYGTPPRQNMSNITLTIDKFNFEPPVFTYPPLNPYQIVLDKQQTLNSKSQLILYGGDLLKDFDVNDQQDHKWDITFKITKEESNTDSDQIFTINKVGVQTGRLSLLKMPTGDDSRNITVEASVKSEKSSKEATITVQTQMNINFFSTSTMPTFKEHSGNISLDENSNTTSAQIPVIASYPHDIAKPFYILLNEMDTFKVDPDTGEISVRHALHYEEKNFYNLTIQATNSKTTQPIPKPDSQLQVLVQVIDLNDNEPIFHPSQFYGALLKSFNQQSIILTVNATDEDSIDKDNLNFQLSETADCQGLLKSSTSNPFSIGQNDGKITPKIKVTSNISGYCKFKVFVQDNANHKDKYDTTHNVNTSVQINVIGDDEIIEFTFINDDSKVIEDQDQITEKIDAIFKKYNYHSKMADPSHNSDMNTTATFYFLDENQNPIKASEILGNLTDPEKFTTLKNALGAIGIYLSDFSDHSVIQGIDDYLKTWLLAITCILATLLMLLSITFFFRNRTLTRRIENLSTTKFGSQESGLNRAGIAAPTTNRNAVEGSNPIYNSENFVKEIEPDRGSILSNDSDLFGVEDNPEFQM